MRKSDPLIRTKLRLPFIRPGLISRPRLQAQIWRGLLGPLTLITAPAGFGKTTLVAACLPDCGLPVAWLSLDKDDNQPGRFLSYMIAALHDADPTIGAEPAQRLAASQQAPSKAAITSLINDLDTTGRDIALVLDDYQFISSQAVHEEVGFLLEHCPSKFHLAIVTRSDPPLPLARLRARGQMVELRADELRFTEPEAAQFLNDLMGLHLDAGSVALLEERTEGWIAGLQMAALSMRDREDVRGFIEGFSGTNRYILDYLLEEVLASQPPEIQRFLLYTSILERLIAPLCDEILNNKGGRLEAEVSKEGLAILPPSSSILEYLERANLFLVPLDDERQWFRYHHLFADLLRTQLQKSIGDQAVARLHRRASEWYEQNGTTLDAIHHASLANDFERIEHLIEQNYIEMMNRGEMSGIRFWMGKLNKDLVKRRPWLCLYEAFSRSWFGQLEEANLMLNAAEKRILAEGLSPGAQAMRGYHDYVKSRVTAMQGDTRRAIELCLSARENTPADNLGMQIEMGITLGYEYFLFGDFFNANQTLYETIQLCNTVGAVNNPIASYALLVRLHVYQGMLHEAYDLIQMAARLIREASGQYLGVTGLVEVETAALLYEWGDIDAALAHLHKGLDLLPLWGKADDLCLAYTTLTRIQLARGDRTGGAGALEKAVQLTQTCAIFSEARSAVEAAQVKLWLLEGDMQAVDCWAEGLEKRFGSHDPFRFEEERIHITQVRVLIAQEKQEQAIRLLSCLEESARLGGRQGRLIEIILLKALSLQGLGSTAQADVALTESLALAEPGGYMRVFLDEGRPVQMLFARWLAQASAGRLRDYAIRLLSHFEVDPQGITAEQEKAPPAGSLVEPLTPREFEVLNLLAEGLSNRQIAARLVLSEGTVKFYVHVVMEKFGVHSRTQAIRAAKERNLL